tara:strand:- start:559 stop:1116 length:558 start_codon:yes stop_codon:yes gene_type:complete
MCSEQNNSKNMFQISERKKLNWQEIITLKHSAKEIWDTDSDYTKRDWGKLLHFILSNITYFDQKDKVIDDMYNLAYFSFKDYKKIKKVVRELFDHKQIKSYFTDQWIVKNEKEILMPNGKSYVPDRLLFSKKNNKVVIIDYKTGNESAKHNTQIRQYVKALKLMGKTNIESFLIYTQEKIKIVRV